MNMLYPEMDQPSGPSIMGSENPKFMERRRNDQSESDSLSEANTPTQEGNHSMESRKSRDGLSREERMKLVRERQLGDHKRRLDELRLAQAQAAKAKQQQDEERRRRLEDIKSRDEQKRAAVDARRKRIEDEERERCEAIIRKHEEIFNRVDAKKRQHESRKMAYGISSYQLSDQDSVYTTATGINGASGSQTARRAVSANVLFRRSAGTGTGGATGAAGNMTSRSYHQSTLFSPGAGQSARMRPSPSTPSRNGGGHFDSMSGSKTTSSENSPVHSGHQRHRAVRSQPPVNRNRSSETARSRQGSRPHPPPTTAPIAGVPPVETVSARAKRPTSLMTRSNGVEKQHQRKEKVATPEAFRSMTKRSQSVGNVSARNRVKQLVESSSSSALKPTTSQRDVSMHSPRKTEEVRFEELPDSHSPEPGAPRTGRKPISEAEAKSALAEKRRQARLKVEFERTREDAAAVDETTNSPQTLLQVTDTQSPSTLGVESPYRDLSNARRASDIEFLELERSFTEESRAFENTLLPKTLPSSDTIDTNENSAVDHSSSSLPEEETVGSGVLTNGGMESQEMSTPVSNSPPVNADREQGMNLDQETVVRDESPTDLSVIAEPVVLQETIVQEESEAIPTIEAPTVSAPVDTPTVVREDIPPPPARSVDMIRADSERRRLEADQREEEERNARRQRLEAIKRLTKSGSNGTTTSFTGSSERLSSPVTETAKPIDALENARKLLQRRGLGGAANGTATEPSSLISSPSTGSFKTFSTAALIGDSLDVKMNGDLDLIEAGQALAEETTRSASGTPFSDASSTDTVSLRGYVRSHDDEPHPQNGFGKMTSDRNGSASAMSDSSSVDFDPYSGKDDWKPLQHLNGTGGSATRTDLWNGNSSLQQLSGGGSSANADLLLNFGDR